MSFFMRIMPLRRLDVEAAGVEAHALAHQRHQRMRRVLPQRMSMSRGSRALPLPTS